MEEGTARRREGERVLPEFHCHGIYPSTVSRGELYAKILHTALHIMRSIRWSCELTGRRLGLTISISSFR